MNTLLNDYRANLNELKETLGKQMSALMDDKRIDETNHLKIRLNIVEIFEKMLVLSEKKVDAAAVESESVYNETLRLHYLQHFDKIPTAWHDMLSKSQAHGDTEKAYIEQLKIDQADTLRFKFEALYDAQTE